jgi:methyl-accepting chemotaxis protein
LKLLTKFNLIVVAVFTLGGGTISLVTYNFLLQNARREVLDQARLMMASSRAMRDYTETDLKPLLEQTPQHKERFLPETVPAFAAITTFNKLRQERPEYTYREPALNPTNLEHRAADWEADVIAYLRDHPEEKEISNERETAMGPSMYLARPFSAGPACMECHSTPSSAPASMIKTYGSTNGFGWKAGSIVAAQIVSVPMSVPVESAKHAFRLLLTYLLITFVVTLFVLDMGVYFIVIRPLKLVSDTADRVSKGETASEPLPVKGSDEIATVTASFNRMQVSLAKAMRMLGN